jgi:Transposase IS66 family
VREIYGKNVAQPHFVALAGADDSHPIDNNALENTIRPLALGRKNWLFVGSRQAGERAANLMSLIESAKFNGHHSWAYPTMFSPCGPHGRTHGLKCCCHITGSNPPRRSAREQSGMAFSAEIVRPNTFEVARLTGQLQLLMSIDFQLLICMDIALR